MRQSHLAMLRRLLRPLRSRLDALFARGVVVDSNATPKMQELQVDFGHGEIRDRVEHFEPYGFTSRPFPGAEVAGLAPSGGRTAVVSVVVADRRFRLQALERGEVALYTDEGTAIVLGHGGIVRVTCSEFLVDASTRVTITAPAINLNS